MQLYQTRKQLRLLPSLHHRQKTAKSGWNLVLCIYCTQHQKATPLVKLLRASIKPSDPPYIDAHKHTTVSADVTDAQRHPGLSQADVKRVEGNAVPTGAEASDLSA